MADLLSCFAKTVSAFPDRPAIVNGDGQSVSFAALDIRAKGLALTWSRAGIKRGDRVLLAMGISSDLYAALAALWSLGATVVLPEPAMGLAGLRHAIKATNVTAFCAAGAYRGLKFLVPALWPVTRLRMHETTGDLTARLADVNDIALISFTSGTTGTPKAIPRSHGFLMAQHDAVAPLLDSQNQERDLVAFPVFALINLANGRTSVLPNWKMSRLANLTASQLGQWITDQNVTRALLPPSLCEKLAQSGQLPGLTHVFTGGGPVFPDILHALQKAQGQLDVTCVYGSTEAEPIAHLQAQQISQSDRVAMQKGQGLLVGRPTLGTHVRIVDDEINVAGDHVNRGYLDPAHDVENKVTIDGVTWHRTGDAGRLDEQGRLWLLGRIGSDVMLAERPTYPFSIEVAVRQWNGVTSCALVEIQRQPVLVLVGDLGSLADWKSAATDMGITQVRRVAAIPMDKRHALKVDRTALIRQLRA
jgi:acyl-CoA synthetase (AMP-forming)/AMP-acid ligase II